MTFQQPSLHDPDLFGLTTRRNVGRSDAGRGLIVDGFAGGGGASMGIEMALGRVVDLAWNHDARALALHQANHPRTLHLQADAWEIDPVQATGGRPVALLWISPDCTFHSKARGGKPIRHADRRQRSLAWVGVRWAKAVRPAVVMLENVEEFSDWGPLGDDEQPIKSRKGETFQRWVAQFEALGYAVEWRFLRACDYGSPTIRRRLFLIARCDGEPIVWPEATHAKGGAKGLAPWRSAAECIDWSLPCPSIFARKRPLAENTLRRIANGLRRYVIESAEPFIVTCNHGGLEFRGQSLAEPMRTVTSARDAHGLVVPTLMTNTSGHAGGSPADPLHTVTRVNDKALVVPFVSRQFGRSTGSACGNPLGTVTAGGGGKSALVSAFLAKHYGGQVGADLRRPGPTTTARGTQNQLVTAHLAHLKGGGDGRCGRDVRDPMPAVCAGGGHIAEVRAFLVKYYSSGGQDQNVGDPMHTLTARARMGLVTVAGQDYQVVDIGMRMLTPRELFTAQGFPADYVIDPIVAGRPLPKTHQVEMCGNSVCPQVAAALVRANCRELAVQEVA